jgi:hypothetical protein
VKSSEPIRAASKLGNLTDCFDDPQVTGKLSTRLNELPGRYDELVGAINESDPGEAGRASAA